MDLNQIIQLAEEAHGKRSVRSRIYMEVIWGHLLDANMFYLYYADSPITIKGNLWQMKKLSHKIASVIFTHSKKRQTANVYNEICMRAEDRLDNFLDPIRDEYTALGLTEHETMSQIVSRVAGIFTSVLNVSLERLESVCGYKLRNKSLEALTEFNSKMAKHMRLTNQRIVDSKILAREWAKVEKSLCSEYVIEKIIAKPLKMPNDYTSPQVESGDQACQPTHS